MKRWKQQANEFIVEAMCFTFAYPEC